MREEEAKEIAHQKAPERFKRLFWSLSGVMSLAVGVLASITIGFLSGYNHEPRIVILAPTALEYQNALSEAATDIGIAVTTIGFTNVPEESQRLLARALLNIKFVREQLDVKESTEPAIFLPKWSMLVSPAYAQAVVQVANPKEDFRQNLALAILTAITVFWVVCLIVYFASKDEKKIAFSATMIQTVLGFYIGVFTGLLGLPSVT